MYAKPQAKLLIAASLGMAFTVSKVSKPKEFAGEVLDSSQSQYQTSVMINTKIDEEIDNNKIDEDIDKPINEVNESSRAIEDSPPLKKKKTIKSNDNQKIYNFTLISFIYTNLHVILTNANAYMLY